MRSNDVLSITFNEVTRINFAESNIFSVLYILKLSQLKMKKTFISTLVVSSIIFFGGQINAQFVLSNFTVENTEIDTTVAIESYGSVENLSPDTMYMGVIRTIQYLVPGQEESFCFGPNCYPSGTDSSFLTDPAIIPPGGTDASFHVTILAHQSCGTSTLHYRFYDQNNIADSVGIDMTFGFCTATAINELSSNYGVSMPSRNPADAFTSFKFNFDKNSGPARMSIYNMLGSLVKSFPLTQKNGELFVNTVDFKPGLYLCSVSNSNSVMSTYKLVVEHK